MLSKLKSKFVALAFLILLFATGCRTVSLPPVNLQEPGWKIQNGEAVWHRVRGGEGIAGEILIAQKNGRAFVQFSKNGFPILLAQSTQKSWQVDLPPQNQHYSGHGLPPQRLIFLYLPRVLSGESPPKNWSWQKLENNGWNLKNRASGESVEIYLSQ